MNDLERLLLRKQLMYPWIPFPCKLYHQWWINFEWILHILHKTFAKNYTKMFFFSSMHWLSYIDGILWTSFSHAFGLCWDEEGHDLTSYVFKSTIALLLAFQDIQGQIPWIWSAQFQCRYRVENTKSYVSKNIYPHLILKSPELYGYGDVFLSPWPSS